MKTYDTARHAHHTACMKKEKPRFYFLGYLKLLVFLVIFVPCYLIYKQGFLLPHVVILMAVVLIFTCLSRWHIKIHETLDYHTGMVQLHQKQLDRLDGSWTSFADCGEEYVDPNHPYAADLDMVGPGSLFQMVNATNTVCGRKQLIDDLLSPGYEETMIAKRQAAIKELGEKRGFSEKFQYHTSKIGYSDTIASLLHSLSDGKLFLRSRVLQNLVQYGTLAAMICVIFTVLMGQVGFYIAAAILLSLQGLIWIFFIMKTSDYLKPAEKAPHIFAQYAFAIQCMEKEVFQSKLLQEIQDELLHGENSAMEAIQELTNIVSRIRIKSNGIAYFLCNMFFLWDIRCCIALDRWKRRYGTVCNQWFLRFGQLESMLSLSLLFHTVTPIAMPQVAQNISGMRAKQLGHPLLSSDVRKCNDASLEHALAIISGSNMSGKTTFLRTVGVNMVLARTGAPVCAEEMHSGIYQVMTSMRITDNLDEGISTFYAELRRIQKIIEAAREEKEIFFLIDEIFRGTNSEDRLFGAKKVIEELYHRKRLGMITTHDLSLCTLETVCPGIQNYHFDEYYKDKSMFFDYQLKRGSAQGSNARFLMEQVGIL